MPINVGDIKKVLNVAWNVRQAGKMMIPCFEGPSGIGKSQAVHQWVRYMDSKVKGGFGMIDLRGATIDSSDTRGLPWKDEKTGQTVFLPPDFLPTKGSGVLFIDEINRSSTPVMNCFMELFTEGRIGNYVLPPGWFPCTAINPGDNEAYDVNSMDEALKNRVKRFVVKFDHKQFVKHLTSITCSPKILAYLNAGAWVYKEPGQGDGEYVSPRSWEQLSDAEYGGALEDNDLHNDFAHSYLGKNIGNDYWAFTHKTKPITYDEIEKEWVKRKRPSDPMQLLEFDSLKAFAAYADPSRSATVRQDLISATLQTILTKADKGVQHVEEPILYAVASCLPTDQTVALIQNLALKAQDPPTWVLSAKKKYKEIFGRLRTSVVKNGVQTVQAAPTP